jgi:hypothetical protein
VELAGVLRALAEHWDDVVGRLDEPARAELRRLIAITTQQPPDPEARTDAVLDIIDLVLPVLPLGHPLEAAIGTKRGVAATVPETELDPTLALLRAVAARAEPEPLTVWQGVRQRLLDADSLSVPDLVTAGGDPNAAHLIRLEDDDGSTRYPAFQFGSRGNARQVVVAVNTILDSDDDPWGAADWWLCPHAWLRAVPADLVDQVDDSVLIETAELETTDDA